MIVYTARHVIPIASPPVPDGAVAVDDSKIVAAGRRSDVLSKAGDEAEVRDLGDAVVLPGLVNAHTHLELSWMERDSMPQGDYLAWLRRLLEIRDEEDTEVARRAAEEAVGQIAERGTVAVGDVANRSWMPGVLAQSPLWAVVFHEIFGFRTDIAERLLDDATQRLDGMEADAKAAEGRVRVALTPHGPHTTSAPLLKALAGRAAASKSPLSIHVAESAIESDFLQSGSDDYRSFLEWREVWDDAWDPPGQSPVEYLDRLHVLSERTLAVHCVHLDRRDLSFLQARDVTVVTCPRSNEWLGVGSTPVPKLLSAGIPVAIGTDSRASAPDSDMFAEVAALRQQHPGLAPLAALRMATLNGAGALGLADHLGTIEPGKDAALVAVPLADPADDPLEMLVSVPETVTRIEAAPWEPQT